MMIYTHKLCNSERRVSEMVLYLTGRVSLICVQDYVRVSIVKFSIVTFRPVGHLLSERVMLTVCVLNDLEFDYSPYL